MSTNHTYGTIGPIEVFPSPVRQPRVIVHDSGDPGYTNRLLVGTPCTGLLRVEWVAARYGQMVPINWSMANYMQMISGYMPLRYQVADAQNLIVAEAIRMDMEWLFLLEHDVIIPNDTFMRLNAYMRDAPAPVVSGLYFSRSVYSEPMIFRGMGQGAFVNWKFGDIVECDGVPTGCLLIHMGLIRAMWKDSEPYTIGGILARRLFVTPRTSWYNPETDVTNVSTGTSDLEWCKRVVEGDYLRKSGWTYHADKQFPFIVDTNIFCHHCNPDGTMFPDVRTRKSFER